MRPVKKREIVTFLSDYGLEDEFVGVCHGVMLRVAPHLQVVHVHHNILRQDIRHGAIVLQQSVAYLPDSVHLAVVDPSVGSTRKAIVVETRWGEVYVGPDNGLLMPAAAVSGGVTRAYEITDERFMLTPVSRTFQGRDVFAPAAAHVANGVDPSEFGPSSSRTTSSARGPAGVGPRRPPACRGAAGRSLREPPAELRHAESSTRSGCASRNDLEVRLEGQRLQVPFGSTFADVKPGEFVLVCDSYQQLSLAINKGDAAARLRAAAGSTAIVGPLAT